MCFLQKSIVSFPFSAVVLGQFIITKVQVSRLWNMGSRLQVRTSRAFITVTSTSWKPNLLGLPWFYRCWQTMVSVLLMSSIRWKSPIVLLFTRWWNSRLWALRKLESQHLWMHVQPSLRPPILHGKPLDYLISIISSGSGKLNWWKHQYNFLVFSRSCVASSCF